LTRIRGLPPAALEAWRARRFGQVLVSRRGAEAQRKKIKKGERVWYGKAGGFLKEKKVKFRKEGGLFCGFL
jgi:hypothetical protein